MMQLSGGVEQLAQPLMRPRQLRLGQARRAAEQRADLGVRVALDVVQPDDEPRGIAEPVERALEVERERAVASTASARLSTDASPSVGQRDQPQPASPGRAQLHQAPSP